jgi:hypothetical protein
MVMDFMATGFMRSLSTDPADGKPSFTSISRAALRRGK